MSPYLTFLALASSLVVQGCVAQRLGDGGSVELGLMDVEAGAFIPCGEGQVIRFEQGRQGGHHAFLDARLHAVTPLGAGTVSLTLLDGTDELARVRHTRAPDLVEASGSSVLTDLILYLPSPEAVVGRELLVRVRFDAGETILTGVDMPLRFEPAH